MALSFDGVGRKAYSVLITGAASAAGGGLGAVANPEGVDVLILRTTLVVLAASTGAANLSVGIAADAVTSAADIVNALAMNGVGAKTAYNGFVMENGAKTAISAGVPALWTTDKFLTFTGSASTVGLSARILVDYVRIN